MQIEHSVKNIFYFSQFKNFTANYRIIEWNLYKISEVINIMIANNI